MALLAGEGGGGWKVGCIHECMRGSTGKWGEYFEALKWWWGNSFMWGNEGRGKGHRGGRMSTCSEKEFRDEFSHSLTTSQPCEKHCQREESECALELGNNGGLLFCAAAAFISQYQQILQTHKLLRLTIIYIRIQFVWPSNGSILQWTYQKNCTLKMNDSSWISPDTSRDVLWLRVEGEKGKGRGTREN